MEEKLMGICLIFLKYKTRIVEDQGDDRCRDKMITL